MQTGTVSRFWLCGRSWRFEIHFWRNLVRFWKSYVCSNKLDVWETNFCFTQFHRIRSHLVGHWTEIGWVPALDLWDLIISVLGNMTQTTERPERPVFSLGNERRDPVLTVLWRKTSEDGFQEFNHRTSLDPLLYRNKWYNREFQKCKLYGEPKSGRAQEPVRNL